MRNGAIGREGGHGQACRTPKGAPLGANEAGGQWAAVSTFKPGVTITALLRIGGVDASFPSPLPGPLAKPVTPWLGAPAAEGALRRPFDQGGCLAGRARY